MRLAVITDEISPDITRALRTCEALGIEHVELRTWDGHNIVQHDAAAVRRVARDLAAGGFSCPVVDTPFRKTPDIDWGHLDRGIAAAHEVGAGVVRVFSGLRSARPARAIAELTGVLEDAAAKAAAEGLRIAVEIEHACNVATAAEARSLLGLLPPGVLGLVWDPGNEAHFLAGRPAVPAPGDAITHVHVKDAAPDGRWVRVGDGVVGWTAQLRALASRGYDGHLSLETHYTVGGDGAAATAECARVLRELAGVAGVSLR